MRLRIVVMFLALPLVLVAVRVDAQVRREVISGRVSVDSNRSVVGATVSVTRAPDRALFQVLTDTAGRFRLVIDSGTGDYLVHVSARSSDARPPFRKRVTRERVGDSLYVVDVVLRDELRPPVLGTVRVQARRPRVERDPDSFGSSAGGGEQLAIGVAAAVAPADKGDLSGLAAQRRRPRLPERFCLSATGPRGLHRFPRPPSCDARSFWPEPASEFSNRPAAAADQFRHSPQYAGGLPHHVR